MAFCKTEITNVGRATLRNMAWRGFDTPRLNVDRHGSHSNVRGYVGEGQLNSHKQVLVNVKIAVMRLGR